VAELLNWVGLGERMHALPATLSGGEKQRLAIARAVVDRPDILLADEPTGNVDPAMSLRLLRLFVELNRLGTTVLIATHDEDMVARANRPALRLHDGRLLGAEPPRRAPCSTSRAGVPARCCRPATLATAPWSSSWRCCASWPA